MLSIAGQSYIVRQIKVFLSHLIILKLKPILCKAKAMYPQHPETLLASLGLSSPKMDWCSVLGSDESTFLKIALEKHSVDWLVKNWTFWRCAARYIWRKNGFAFNKKNIRPIEKKHGGNVMVWGCFTTLGPGECAVIDGTVNYTRKSWRGTCGH